MDSSDELYEACGQRGRELRIDLVDPSSQINRERIMCVDGFPASKTRECSRMTRNAAVYHVGRPGGKFWNGDKWLLSSITRERKDRSVGAGRSEEQHEGDRGRTREDHSMFNERRAEEGVEELVEAAMVP